MSGKTCSKCGTHYADVAGAFHRHTGKGDGLQAHCRTCRAADAHRRWETRERKPRKKPTPRPQKDASLGLTCSRCGTHYGDAAAHFHRQASGPGGFRSWCKDCRKGREGQTPKARERRRLRGVRWRGAHPERAKASRLAWRLRNPDCHRATWHRRKAKKSANGGTYRIADIRRQLAIQDGRCFWCDAEMGEGRTVDHLIPLSRGGSNWPWNIVLACGPCNYSKNDLLPLDFARTRLRARLLHAASEAA